MEGELQTSCDEPERVVPSFATALASFAPFPMQAALAAELSTEAAAVLDAFSRAIDPVGVREAMALAGLLGRRVAELGASAVELVAVLEALLLLVGPALDPIDQQALRGLVFEGFTRAHLERDRERELAARVRATRPFLLAPRCVALVLQGSADNEWIAGSRDQLGPMLLRADARVVVVFAHLDGELGDGVVGELSAVVDLAQVVGAQVVFECAEALAGLLRPRVEGHARVVIDDTAAAVADALAEANTSAADVMRARVAGLLKRLGV